MTFGFVIDKDVVENVVVIVDVLDDDIIAVANVVVDDV
jgi:hypothetical protein